MLAGMTFGEVREAALRLPEDERRLLGELLLGSVAVPFDAEVEAAWDAEIQRRLARWKAGEVKPNAAEETFALLRELEA